MIKRELKSGRKSLKFIFFRLFDETSFFFDCTISVLVLYWLCVDAGFFSFGN